MQPQKQKFDFHYWIQQLIQAGSIRQPEKFTPQYNQKLIAAWRNQPLSNLVQKVQKRRNQNP